MVQDFWRSVYNEPSLKKTYLGGFGPGPVQPQKMAKGLKFQILEVEGLISM